MALYITFTRVLIGCGDPSLPGSAGEDLTLPTRPGVPARPDRELRPAAPAAASAWALQQLDITVTTPDSLAVVLPWGKEKSQRVGAPAPTCGRYFFVCLTSQAAPQCWKLISFGCPRCLFLSSPFEEANS
jgi:hypothetical protein